jgi:DNA-directed RNA polymerase specialized sigma24 family protein
VLREMEALSYDQIAEVLDKTVPAVKSLLVRARVSLTEKSLARAA